jgi:hypothetical protein
MTCCLTWQHEAMDIEDCKCLNRAQSVPKFCIDYKLVYLFSIRTKALVVVISTKIAVMWISKILC